MVGLLGSGLLRAMPYQHLSGKRAHGIVIEHILVEFIAIAMSRLMVYKGIVVHSLVFVGYHAAMATARGSLSYIKSNLLRVMPL